MLCTAQFVYCDAVYCTVRVLCPPHNASVTPFISDFPFRRFVKQKFAEIRTDDSFLNSSAFLRCSAFVVIYRTPSLSLTTGVDCRMSRRAVECSGGWPERRAWIFLQLLRKTTNNVSIGIYTPWRKQHVAEHNIGLRAAVNAVMNLWVV